MREQQTLGRRIQEGRKAAGLSQESLGERLGVSRQAVSKWEADAAVPELENLIAMSRIFGVTIGALLGVEPPEAPSEGDAPESPGDGAEDAAPAGELTDRELAAVEAIVQKYLEAVQRPRWSRRKKLAAGAAACAAGLLTVLVLNGIFSSLGRRLDQVQDQVNYVQSSVSSQIGSLTGQLSGLLEEQNSLISDYTIQIQDYDLEKAVWYLTASVTPKAYTAGTVATFTARTNTGKTESAQARNDGGVFTVENWAVPMGEPVPPGVMDADDDESGSRVQVSVTLTDGDTSQIESLETLYEDPSAYQLWINGNWEEEWENSCLLFQELDLQISNETDIPLELTDAELALFSNDDAVPVWSAPLTTAMDLWNRQGYVQMHVPMGPEDPVPLHPGDTLVAAVRIADDHGRNDWRPFYYWQNDDGTLVGRVSAPDGWQPGDLIPIENS
ncbi:helix-turn-helix transcriptional regulator [uncultured Oscillibacter sp.]|uniref:helix-turn-helix domain-containing protein n=1 Tax=uncultured Oscillibacter sp. TaxID=876091 RepID=UPI002805C1B1|nr:helix-turn-helix transcriptional regulator [uncultured Oscillibacter sp.]